MLQQHLIDESNDGTSLVSSQLDVSETDQSDETVDDLLSKVASYKPAARLYKFCAWFLAATTLLILAKSTQLFLSLWMSSGSPPTVHFDPSLMSFVTEGTWGTGHDATIVVTLGPLALVVMYIVLIHYQRRLHRRAVESLAGYDDKRIIGTLIDEMRLGECKGDPAVRNALVRLLPQLGNGDQSLLNPGHRLRIHLYLAYRSTDHNLTLALLEALGSVGSQDDLSVLERVAAGKGSARNSGEIRAAARTAADTLRERLRKELDPSVLLRAAERPVLGANELLRAVRGAGTADNESLLRPHSVKG